MCRNIMLIFLTMVVVTIEPMVAHAQVDDLGDEPRSIPQWDALQRFRDDPLCLPCLEVADLMVLPGMDRRTAQRVLKHAPKAPSMEDLADSCLLSVDQRMVLLTTVTMDCLCGPSLTSARMRNRAAGADDRAPDMSTRVDVLTSLGRIGGYVRQTEDGPAFGGWLLAQLGPVTLAAGDIALRSGNGIVHGGGGGFGRGPMSRALEAEAAVRLRPWSSTWTDGAMRGGSVSFDGTVFGRSLNAAGMYSNRTVDDRKETVVGGTLITTAWKGRLGVNVQHVAYDSAVESRSMSVIAQQQRTLASVFAEQDVGNWFASMEVAVDDSLRPAVASTMLRPIAMGRFVIAARWSHPDIRNPFASHISSLSSLGNEAGILVGTQLRPSASWIVEASADIHGIVSKSYGRPLPSTGLDLLADIERRVTATTRASVRLRYETDDEGWRPPDSAQTIMVRRQRVTTRGEVSLTPVRQLRVRMRADARWLWFDRLRSFELGVLGYLDVRWTPSRTWTVDARLTAYRSPSIESAAYTLEAPVVGQLTTVAGSGDGVRFYVAARKELWSWLTMSAAAGNVYRLDTGDRVWATFQMDLALPRW